MKALSKYVIPTSLTWWTGIASLIAGFMILLGSGTPPAVAALAGLAEVATSFFPGQAGGDLIIAGLGLIGIRKAVGESAVASINAAIDLAKAVDQAGKTPPAP